MCGLRCVYVVIQPVYIDASHKGIVCKSKGNYNFFLNAVHVQNALRFIAVGGFCDLIAVKAEAVMMTTAAKGYINFFMIVFF